MTVAVVALLAVVGLGFVGQKQAEGAAAEVAEEVQVARYLLDVEQAAGEGSQVARVAGGQLEQLGTLSRELAGQKEPAVAGAAGEAVSVTVGELLERALGVQDPAERFFLVATAQKLWAAALEDGSVEGLLPPFVREQVAAASCQQEKVQAPASVAGLVGLVFELDYATGFYGARADVDALSDEVTELVVDAGQRVALLKSETLESLACVFVVPAREAVYVVDGDPQAELERLERDLVAAVDVALADAAVQERAAVVELVRVKFLVGS